jgi:hypothetical protein
MLAFSIPVCGSAFGKFVPRFLSFLKLTVNRIKTRYIEMPFVTMRTGGISNRNIMSNFTLNLEIARACRENGVSTSYLLIYSKYFRKIFEYFGNRQERIDGLMD